MSQSFAERNEAWEGRAKALGPRAVLHVGHKTTEAQAAVFKMQSDAILPLFEKAIEYDRPKVTLDFGCGVGRWSEVLARITNGYVMGVDPTRSFLTHAEEQRKSPAVEYLHYADGHIPLANDSADAVWACMVLSTILDVRGGMFDQTLVELNRVLRKGGLMFLIDNTSGPVHRPVVRSPYSISRTVDEYRAAFLELMNVDLEVLGAYTDLAEVNTIFAGRKR